MSRECIMNNFAVTVTAYGEEALNAALSMLAFGPSKVIAFRKETIVNKQALYLHWTGIDVNMGVIPLLEPRFVPDMTQSIGGWLDAVPYPKEPDHDGDNVKGWTVTNVGLPSNCICKITPEWAMQGK